MNHFIYTNFVMLFLFYIEMFDLQEESYSYSRSLSIIFYMERWQPSDNDWIQEINYWRQRLRHENE